MGTKEGALKARQREIEKFGSYEAYKKALASRGSKGGKKSKRGPAKKHEA